jgi:hypothetical protein
LWLDLWWWSTRLINIGGLFTPWCSYLPEKILLNYVAAKESSLINIFGEFIFADFFYG